ncbi:tryptophanase leader peptide [Vibrio sp. MACH09]
MYLKWQSISLYRGKTWYNEDGKISDYFPITSRR